MVIWKFHREMRQCITTTRVWGLEALISSFFKKKIKELLNYMMQTKTQM